MLLTRKRVWMDVVDEDENVRLQSRGSKATPFSSQFLKFSKAPRSSCLCSVWDKFLYSMILQ